MTNTAHTGTGNTGMLSVHGADTPAGMTGTTGIRRGSRAYTTRGIQAGDGHGALHGTAGDGTALQDGGADTGTPGTIHGDILLQVMFSLHITVSGTPA